jgi:hypothetical protein
MQNLLLRAILFFYILLFTGSCATVKKVIQTTADIKTLKLIGQYVIPYDLKYNNTTVGGLSGIDYDEKNKLFYLISDDRSDRNPARFYTASIFFSQTGIDSLVFRTVNNMLQEDGTVYPNNKQDRFHTPDPEAMRYDPVNKQLMWSSEGEKILTAKDTVLENPAINIISTNGKYKDSFPLPANLHMHVTERGPRKNSVLEGMSFADNYKILFVNVEEPLYEDGPGADVTENEAYARIYKFDVASKKNIAQYAYKLSPVAYPAIPETAFKINGIPDILSIENNKLLIIERSFSTGRLPCTIKLFIADLNGATDISNMELKNNKDFIPAAKKLLLNMDDLGIYTDNIEGVTFGPLLPNGHKTLLFIADNNFNSLEKAQVLLFEVIE